MKVFIKYLVGFSFFVSLLASAGMANAELAPDVLVKQTADDVLTIIKDDKEIQAGNQQKLYGVIEEKILPNFDFDRVCRMVL
ncbi:MAG: ABC transporter substrate-binding protein, partial [Methylotenera sp.]|nr:ABC transporter substrate-binding protein [Methylotenera sp.]